MLVWFIIIRMFVEALGCKFQKKLHIVNVSANMEYGVPLDHRNDKPEYGYIGNDKAFCAKVDDGFFIQVNLGTLKTITKLKIQGFKPNGTNYRIPAFTIQYSLDNRTWYPYRIHNNVLLLVKWVIGGGSENDIFIQKLTEPPIVAQFLRLYPKMKKRRKMCIRFDFFGCGILSPNISSLPLREVRIHQDVNLPCTSYGSKSMILEWKSYPETASNITVAEKDASPLTSKLPLRPTFDELLDYECKLHSSIVRCSRKYRCRSYYMFHPNLHKESVTELVVNIVLPDKIEFVKTYKNRSGILLSWKRPPLNDVESNMLNYSLTCNISGIEETNEFPLHVLSTFLSTSKVYQRYQCHLKLMRNNFTFSPFLPFEHASTVLNFTSLSVRPDVKLFLDVVDVLSDSVKIFTKCNFTLLEFGEPKYFMVNATLTNYGNRVRPVGETWKQDVNEIIEIMNAKDGFVNSSIKIKKLKPWSKYKIQVAVLNNDNLKSNYSVLLVNTKEGRPSHGPSLKEHYVTIETVTLQITNLNYIYHNGKLKEYQLFIKPINRTKIINRIRNDKNYVTINDLEPSRNYTFLCRAATVAGYGPYGDALTVKMKSGKPFPPSEVTSVHTDPLLIAWTKPTYGEIKGYDIKVLFVNQTEKEFTSKGVSLRYSFKFSGTIVRNVAVRSFTVDDDKKIHSDWSPPYPVNLTVIDPSYKKQQALIIGFSVAFAIFAAFVVMCFIYFKRHYQSHTHQMKDNYQLDAMLNGREVHVFEDDLDSEVFVGSAISGRSSDTSTCNLAGSTHDPLPVEEFSEYLNIVKQDDYKILLEDFRNQMPVGKCYSWHIADLPENRDKNRYTNICAYDHSRIVLKYDGTEGILSDYINANSIYGYKKHEDGRYKYISTQGPTEETLADFWHMVWQEGCNIIVMLTNLKENDKVKCSQYWPHESTKKYGNICVTLDKIDKTADYITRTFQLEHANTKEQRTVRQFHFVPWPDHGVPDYPTALLSLRRRVRHYYEEGKPMVVHCSAGIGRTGCFILIDAMLERIDNEKTVDIFNYLNYMRTRRICMVQTSEQYIFAHIAVLEYITYGNTETFVGELDKKFKELVRGNGMDEEFAVLERNKVSDLRPGNASKVLLREGRFVEAFHVDGFKQRDAFILTKAPSEDNIIDFWKMVLEKQCHTIVMLNKCQEVSQEYFKYWPDVDGHNAYQNIAVMLNSEVANGNIMTRKIKVTTNNRRCEVNHFQFVDWQDTEIPDQRDYNNICTLMQAVEKSQHNLGNGPIIVHSGNDYGRSGTFIAIYNSTERLKVEQLIDVLQCVRSIRITQPLAVDNVSQYQFIYNMLRTYLEGFENYCNYKEYNVCRSPFSSTSSSFVS